MLFLVLDNDIHTPSFGKLQLVVQTEPMGLELRTILTLLHIMTHKEKQRNT